MALLLACFLHLQSGTLGGCIRLNRGEADTPGGCWLGAPGGAPGLFYEKNAGTRADSFRNRGDPGESTPSARQT